MIVECFPLKKNDSWLLLLASVPERIWNLGEKFQLEMFTQKNKRKKTHTHTHTQNPLRISARNKKIKDENNSRKEDHRTQVRKV